MPHAIALALGDLTAGVATKGAQLVSLAKKGVPYLYEGDAPAFWAKCAPLLFPVVGRCSGDRFEARGRSFPMPRHGFARDQEFAVLAADSASARLRLRASARTREHYPFEFTLEAHHELFPGGLRSVYRVGNEGEDPMPFSFGLHPAFRWPLDATPRDRWRVRFPRAMTVERVHLVEGLRGPRCTPLLTAQDSLPLSDPLFLDDALVIEDPRVTTLALESPDSRRSVTLRFSPVSWLGIWSLPGAPFVCLEPWQGVAGRAGETGRKEGLLTCAPGAEFRFELEIRVV
ncbi:MAG: aldose 1-epimerase family protein [Planctomycetaceae bacterium]